MANDPESKRGVEATSSIVGIWELLSYSWHFPDGHVLEPWGKAVGRISYDAHGNMMALLMHEQRNQADGSNRCDPGTADSYSAYFGTYRVDSAHGRIRHQVTGSLNGNSASGELLRTFEFEDGLLVLTFSKPLEGVPVIRRGIYGLSAYFG
jgi:Lipocalin-like domain